MKTIEEVSIALKEVLQKWCAPKILEDNYYGISPSPCVCFEVCRNQEDHILIRIIVRHDPFGTTRHIEERTYYSITYIDTDILVSQFFHALTFKGSPYYFYKNHFKKKMELMG